MAAAEGVNPLTEITNQVLDATDTLKDDGLSRSDFDAVVSDLTQRIDEIKVRYEQESDNIIKYSKC